MLHILFHGGTSTHLCTVSPATVLVHPPLTPMCAAIMERHSAGAFSSIGTINCKP